MCNKLKYIKVKDFINYIKKTVTKLNSSFPKLVFPFSHWLGRHPIKESQNPDLCFCGTLNMFNDFKLFARIARNSTKLSPRRQV